MAEWWRTLWEHNGEVLKAVGLAALVLLLFFVFAFFLRRKIAPSLAKWLQKGQHPVWRILLNGFHRPVAVFLRVAGVLAALLVLAHWLPQEVLPDVLDRALRWLPDALWTALHISIIITIAWGLISSNALTGLVLRNARNHLDLNMSKSVTRFLTAVFNVIILGIAAVALLHEFDIDINGLVAGLGLGGLTIALAAQDSAKNFFGGLVLIVEKPFEIGDWIVCGGVEGSVEDINLRSTKVRTVDGSLSVVPNATLSSGNITNWTTGMKKRRANFTLQFVKNTPLDSLKEFVKALTDLLGEDPEVLEDGILVHFNDISPASLDVMVVYYTAKPGYGTYLHIRERLNFAIMELAEAHGLAFAYPTSMVYMEEDMAAAKSVQASSEPDAQGEKA